MTFGEKIVDIRVRKLITRKELSRLSGLTTTTLCLFEKNKRLPTALSVAKIAKALNVDYDDLIQYLPKNND